MKTPKIYYLLSIPFTTLLFNQTAIATPHEQEETPVEEIAGEMDDLATVTTIKSKYAADPLLGIFEISVEAEGSHVSISGELDSDMQFERAVMLALNAPGIESVDSTDLTIKQSEQPIEDLVILAQLKSELFQMGLFGDENPELWSVQIEANDGVVYLTGQVDSQETKYAIVEAGMGIQEVRDVREDLTIINE